MDITESETDEEDNRYSHECKSGFFCFVCLSLFNVCRLYSGCVPREPKCQQGKVFF